MSKRFSLILALLLPVLFILIVGLAAYLPGIWIKPQHSFLYSIDHYLSKYQFVPKDDQLVSEDTPEFTLFNDEISAKGYPDYTPDFRPDPKLYLHDVASNRSREISLEAVNQLTLNFAEVSPDGFRLNQSDSNSSIFLWGYSSSRSYSYQLVGQGVRNTQNLNYEPSTNLNFKAWIV